MLGFYLTAMVRGWREARRHPRTDRGMYGLYVFSGLTGFIFAAQFVSIEGLEVPYFVALVGAASMKLLASASVPLTASATDAPATARDLTLPPLRWTGQKP
jgi:hypothetical protein